MQPPQIEQVHAVHSQTKSIVNRFFYNCANLLLFPQTRPHNNLVCTSAAVWFIHFLALGFTTKATQLCARHEQHVELN